MHERIAGWLVDLTFGAQNSGGTSNMGVPAEKSVMPKIFYPQRQIMVQSAGPSSAVTLTECQKRAWSHLSGRGNVFLTGQAGTGKSELVNRFRSGLDPAKFPVVASTGAAALIVGGCTFHSFFGLGILSGGGKAAADRAVKNRYVVARMRKVEGVIIDEVSMLSDEVLAAAEEVARRARVRNDPWGGLRVIAVGDFFQLPPVTESGKKRVWAFHGKTWALSNFVPAVLKTIVRTSDPTFVNVLSCVRLGNVPKEVTDFLNARR